MKDMLRCKYTSRSPLVCFIAFKTQMLLIYRVPAVNDNTIFVFNFWKTMEMHWLRGVGILYLIKHHFTFLCKNLLSIWKVCSLKASSQETKSVTVPKLSKNIQPYLSRNEPSKSLIEPMRRLSSAYECQTEDFPSSPLSFRDSASRLASDDSLLAVSVNLSQVWIWSFVLLFKQFSGLLFV